jgi:hypothetical protein
MNVKVSVLVTRSGGKPVRGATVRFVDGRTRTDRAGRAKVSATLETPGRFAVFARKGERYGISDRMAFNVDSGSTPAKRRGRG